MCNQEDEDKNSSNVVSVEERGHFFKGENMGKEWFDEEYQILQRAHSLLKFKGPQGQPL